MSTTNIDEQKIIQKIESSDTIKDFMEKCNNNFSKIFEFGSGPEGKQGVEGSQGVPTKPKVPIHVWREGVEYSIEKTSNDGGYVIDGLNVNLTDIIYQEGHLIMLKNGHVYILEEENSTLKPNYIMALQPYNQDDVIDGKSAYIHIAYANSTGPEYVDFTTNEKLQNQENVGNGEIKYKYMGIYSDCNENSDERPYIYTWVRIVGDTGEKGDKGDKGDTPSSTSVEVVGYSLEDLDLDSKNWEKTISDLGELKPGTPIYMLNKYTWNDGTVTLGKTVTMAGTQGIKGETGRVLFYLGSFSDGTLKKEPVKGLLNEDRCDYYIDATGQAWMRTGTSEIADGHMFGKDNIEDNWVPSDKVGFLQAGAISADMINVETLAANKAFIDEMVANKAFINNLVADEAVIKKIQSTEISADKITSGKISSDGEKSYFDLDTGEFVLGNDNKGGGALSYIGGKLHIGGLQNIGGRNLLQTTSYNHFYNAGDTVYFTKLMELESGKKYIATYGKFENNANGATNETFNEVCLAIGQSGALENIEKVVKFGEPFEANNNGRYLYIAWAISDYVDYTKGTSPNIETNTSFTQSLDQVMLQEGEVATAFQPSIDEELLEIEQAQENFQNSLNNINSDEYFSIAEKKIIRTDWETISGDVKTTGTNKDYSSLNGNYGEAYRAAESSSIATTDIDTAFVSLRDYLNTHKLYENTDTSWGSTGRKTLAEKFTAYYNAESALWSAINNAYADSKAFDDTAYSYLKKALANDTDIEGGLIATSQIQLRDWDDTTKKYKVNAGISGIEDDNVLLWGGGTYEEAVYAASTDNDFYVGENKSGRQITSLLKKDGQGKIGIFHIEEDQVQVKTNDGNVVIDDIDGLSCKIESQEHAAVLVTPKELKTFEELKKLGESINRNYEYPSPFNNDISYTIHESFGPKYGFSNRISFKVFVGSGGTIKISGNIKYTTSQIDDRYNQGPNKISIGSQSYDGISCEIYNSKGEQINKTNTFVSDDDCSFINITVPTADTYTIEAYARIYIDFDLHMLEQKELESGIEVEMTLLEGKNIYNEYNTYLSIETNYQIAEQQTMVAYKGIFSYQGDKAYFYYKDGVGLDCQIGNVRFSVNDKGILINGLQEGSSGLTKGMLYSSNGTLKIVQ